MAGQFPSIWDMLAYEFSEQPGDPPRKAWYLSAGDRVEIVQSKTGEVFAAHEVTAANGTWFRIDDGRLFAQRGRYPAMSGSRSPIRARRLK